MFAAHLASALAIRTAEPRAPAAALLVAAFLPDFLWISLAGAGIEPAGDAAFFDGWSHSIVSIVAQAVLFAVCFRALGLGVMLAIGAAVVSHLVLDLPIHPRPLELWPHAAWTSSTPTWAWGQLPALLGRSRYWWCQLAITIPLLGIYAFGAHRQRLPANLIAASGLIVLGLHLVV
jgi:hypothetical protein